MSPNIALILCIFFIIILFIFYEKPEIKVSNALWFPTIWMMMVGTRTFAQWLSATGLIGDIETKGVEIAQYIEGNPIDRSVYFIFIFVGLFILFQRNVNWSELLQNNSWLFLLILYGGISILWSDYPFVSFKRWFKSFGNILMVLVVLTDQNPVEAIKTMIKRFAFIFVPLSIVLIKYYPDIGKEYGFFGGDPYFTGATTGKNALGALCVVCGFFFIWDMTVMWGNNIIASFKNYFIDLLMLAMIFWLFNKASSATSYLCFIIGALFVLWSKMRFIQGILNHGIAYVVMMICILFLMFNCIDYEQLISPAVDMTGHADTFWGRTVLWDKVIHMTPNTLIGAGFESFWLGGRLERLWDIYWWHPNQAHNGYVEIYINLGVVGLFLLCCFIFSTYKKLLLAITYQFDYGKYRLGFFIMALLYNVTEAAMKGLHFMWFMLLLCALELPRQIRTHSGRY